MIVGCYTLDLYCDKNNPDHDYFEFPHQFTGRSLASCIRQAKSKGWSVGKEKAICPKCKKITNTDK
jgi:hypothetical protein